MDKCALCQNVNLPLEKSHIISKMFFNAIKQKSITGYLRQAKTPNRREQDGLKIPFLCKRCEELFSKYETNFSIIFQDAIEHDGDVVFGSNSPHIAYFLLSISWRVIHFVLNNTETSFSHQEQIKIREIVDKWRTWLNEENMYEICKIQQFIIPTKRLKVFQFAPERIYNTILMDFRTPDSENEFKYSFTIVQVPYFIFITSVWGRTTSMKAYTLGKKIRVYSSQLPDIINNVLCENHVNYFYEAKSNLSSKQRDLIIEQTKNKFATKME